MLDAALLHELGTVPELTTFATVDELTTQFERLAAHHPEACVLERVGRSRLGEPLQCLTVGDGDAHAVVFALPHPHEPVGGLTTIHLATRLCEDAALRERLGLTWHILPCVDPDGTRLNEGWLHGPLTRTHYARNFYRPAPDEQVDWTFPFSYKRAYFDGVLPETVALMRLIDRTRPVFLCSLHNGEVGGVYYYLSRPEPRLYPLLQEIPTQLGLPLDIGEPEQPHIEMLSTSIFRTTSPRTAYDFAERAGLEPLHYGSGESSAGYAGRYGTLTLISEVPYWTNPCIGDASSSGKRYADALREHAKELHDLADRLSDTLRAVQPDLVSNSPFLRATRTFAVDGFARVREMEYRADLPDTDRAATVAEAHSLQDTTHCFRLRYAGMLLRALHGELAVGNGTPTIRAHQAALAEAYDTWCCQAERADISHPIPIKKLVATQYGAMLGAAEHVMARRPAWTTPVDRSACA